MQPSLNEKIQHYLYYNYVPQGHDLAWISEPINTHDCAVDYSPSGAGQILDGAIDQLFSRISPGGYVVVPLSGGWDSRILLGAALERFDSSRIKTVSYGVPGQLDFDIGAQIAKALGLEHRAVDLSKVELTWKNLLTSAKEAPWTYVPDGYFNRLAVSQVAKSDKDIVLSGFMGEALTGGHLSRATTIEEAIKEFVSKQRREKSIRLYSPEYDPRSALPDLPEQSRIPYSELLDFGVRQAHCITSIITPQKFWNSWGGHMGRMPSTGATMLAPFTHPKWAGYWLQAPRKAKIGQKLYLEMMHHKYAKLATMPSKYSLAVHPNKILELWVVKTKYRFKYLMERFSAASFAYTSPTLNYLDYASAFRSRSDYGNPPGF